MGLLRRAEYDRAQVLSEAAHARERRRRRRAIALYRRVLAVEPGNVEVLGRLAPLLAETGQAFDAWNAYREVGRACLRERRVERALETYRDATERMPRQVQAWLAVAELERKLGRVAQAVETLRQGRERLRRRQRAEAIHLLRRAHALSPWDVDVVIDLAGLLARADQRDEADLLLRELGERCAGRELRRVRAAHWRLEPSLAHTWHWLRAAVA